MADFSSRVTASSEDPAARGVAAGKAAPSVAAGNGSWDGGAGGGMDQITVVRIDDTHIAEERVKGDAAEYYEVEYSLPGEEELAAAEEEEDGVYVIEYSNPEEEGESYQFTMSVDRSLPAQKPTAKGAAPPSSPLTSKPSRLKRKLMQQEEQEEQEEEVVSNKSVLELGEDYSDVLGSAGKRRLVCSLCPPPGKLFKRASGLAVHLKQMHHMEGKKTFFCASCKQAVRTQIELDAHTRRHANQDAVFTCLLCSAAAAAEEGAEEGAGFKGSRWGLRRHLEKEHPGVIPRCDVCNKGFKSLVSYLADQFRHVGVSPFYCAKCQIYEMTERGLSVHVKNHDKKKKKQQQQQEEAEAESPDNHAPPPPPPPLGVSTSADNSATDDSDF